MSEIFIQRLVTDSTLLPELSTLDLGWVNAMSSPMAEALSKKRPHLNVTGSNMSNIFNCGLKLGELF